VIDAVRCAKLALDRGIGGSLEAPSSYFMKSPPVQYSDNEARRLVEEFIEGDKPGVNGQRDRRAARARPAAAARR
jgi:myo-inositol-1-phosphate synthase